MSTLLSQSSLLMCISTSSTLHLIIKALQTSRVKRKVPWAPRMHYFMDIKWPFVRPNIHDGPGPISFPRNQFGLI
jgi:hypothetical protein